MLYIINTEMNSFISPKLDIQLTRLILTTRDALDFQNQKQEGT